MIHFYDKDGNSVDVARMTCTPEGSRRVVAGLNASGSTVPYTVIKLPKRFGLSIQLVTEKAAAPKPKHVAAFPDSDLGDPKVER